MGVCVEIDVDAVGIVGVGIVDGNVGIGVGISFGVSVYAGGGATGTETIDAGVAGAGATYVVSVGFVVSVGINSLVPHPVQNVAPAVDLLPQFTQNISSPPFHHFLLILVKNIIQQVINNCKRTIKNNSNIPC